MSNQSFIGQMRFFVIQNNLPSGPEVLSICSECSWELDPYNAAFLAGKGPQPEYKFQEIIPGKSNSLPQGWTEQDTQVVIGDISQKLLLPRGVLAVECDNFQEAERLADIMGYRPAEAGEFLQVMRWLSNNSGYYLHGWFYCYRGRKPGYAIISTYTNPASKLEVAFDTYLPNGISEIGDSSMENWCVFIAR
ncbi:MAG: hypothetical protein WCT08_04760 [Patescibacteria group bacterium]|jgi:hypothetical protein